MALVDYGEQPPFFTGSRVYGVVRRKSDLDLVVRVPHDRHEAFWALLGPDFKADKTKYKPWGQFVTLRWGMVNILACMNWSYYYAWELATKKCKAAAPLLHGDAVEIFHRVFADWGLQ